MVKGTFVMLMIRILESTYTWGLDARAAHQVIVCVCA